jgi:Multicopper oxidase.
VRSTGERYDFVITADQPNGAYWIQVRGLGECGNKRAMQLAVLRYARGPYQPATQQPTYDVGLPQGVVRNTHVVTRHESLFEFVFHVVAFGSIKMYVKLITGL